MDERYTPEGLPIISKDIIDIMLRDETGGAIYHLPLVEGLEYIGSDQPALSDFMWKHGRKIGEAMEEKVKMFESNPPKILISKIEDSRRSEKQESFSPITELFKIVYMRGVMDTYKLIRRQAESNKLEDELGEKP